MNSVWRGGTVGLCRKCRHDAPLKQVAGGVAWYSYQPQNTTTKERGVAGAEAENEKKQEKEGDNATEELGPMARRLQEATEEALFTGGRSGRRAVEDAGFSDELKEKLLDKIADAKFKSDFSGALDEAGITNSEGVPRSNYLSNSEPWTGQETAADAVLRMLDDAKKPLKPELRGKFQPGPINTRLKRPPIRSPGQRAASAKDKASLYSGMGMKDGKSISERERQEVKEQLQDRFRPEGRSGHVVISAIASLANQRIEDAIARGQFKDISRGKEMERDARADNPFIDTTEYLMNKLIKRQDIVPPWIEKQQEVVRTANMFRQRLRNDWKRHAARMIASKGGSLLEQMQRAEQYAAAEKLHNLLLRSIDQIPVSAGATDDPVMVGLRQQVETFEQAGEKAAISQEPSVEVESGPLPPPFRDPEWVHTEQKYMQLSIENLNNMTRSYNLMAPDLAKKPYFSLERELGACYASVAPLLAKEIQVRATRPLSTALGSTVPAKGDPESIMGRFTGKDNVPIHLEANEKAYGLREWWRDFWKNR